MDDYDIGYGKPPNATRFKHGTSGNPRGRPKRIPSLLGDIVNDVLDAPIRYRENGRSQTATRREVALKLHVQHAIKGDVAAAGILLSKRAYALRRAGTDSNRLLIRDWLPDYPGQTAEQKARDLGSAIESQIVALKNVSPPLGRSPETEGGLEETSATGAVHEVAE